MDTWTKREDWPRTFFSDAYLGLDDEPWVAEARETKSCLLLVGTEDTPGGPARWAVDYLDKEAFIYNIVTTAGATSIEQAKALCDAVAAILEA